jgi:branched-chain amino acid transport system substrate-binding protein
MAHKRTRHDAESSQVLREMDRRDFLRLTAYGGAALGLGGVLAACGQGTSASASAAASAAPSAAAPSAAPSVAMGRTLKIGYVTPTTGPFSAFAEADEYVIAGVKEAIGPGVANADLTYPIDIVVKDSQGDPNRAAEVAGELILDEKVDLMLVASTPETTNPVSDQCEANGVPCVSTVAPWQPYFLGRQPNVAPPDTKPFAWTYHFFWGLEDIISVFQDMWSQVDNNKTVGFLMPNDGDGQAWSSPEVGFPASLTPAGYTIVDPGRYENLSQDFSNQISQFKSAGVEIMTGVPLPPDFTTFWTQAAQQGFKPKIASIGKALLFPASVDALGPDLGVGLSSEVWWSPSHPFSSSLTGATAKALADGYTTATTKQWTQPIGFAHAVFEVAVDVLRRAASLDDKAAIRDAIKATALDSVVGHIEWNGEGLPPFAATNVAKTPLVGGQWVKGTGDFQYDLVIVSNKDQPDIPAGGTMQAIA